MKYKVGDKVRIIRGLYENPPQTELFKRTGYLKEMSEFEGKVVTITYIYSQLNCYSIFEDCGRYNWCDDMLEDVKMSTNELFDHLKEKEKKLDKLIKMLKDTAQVRTFTDNEEISLGSTRRVAFDRGLSNGRISFARDCLSFIDEKFKIKRAIEPYLFYQEYLTTLNNPYSEDFVPISIPTENVRQSEPPIS